MSFAHGFRIYVVDVFHDQVKDHEPIDVSSESDARDHILDLLEGLHAAGTRHIHPRVPAVPGHPAKPSVSVTVGQPIVVRQDLIHVPVSVGEMGAHRQATRPGKKAKRLAKWSAEVDHIITFVFPKVPDHPMIVVASSFRRRDAVGRLLSLMTARSLELKKAAKQAEDEAREKAKAAGEKVPRRQPFHRVLFTRRQGSDNTYLNEIIKDSTKATALFEQRIDSDRGPGKTVVRRSLRINLVDEADRDAGKTVSRRWTGRFRRGETTSRADGVSELAAELSSQDLVTEEEASGYTNASIFVRSGTGDSTTIAVDTLKDVFTYPVSDGRPSALYYYERVAPRLKIVAAEESIEIDQLDAMEVEQCLVASTSDHS